MVYVLDYDTVTGERTMVTLPGEVLEDALAATRQAVADLAMVRARLVDVSTASAVETGRWVAVYSRGHGWTSLEEDYRDRWVQLSPRARAAVRADASTVPGRYLAEMARVGLAVAGARRGGGERALEWVVPYQVQAFVAALPADPSLPAGRG